MSKTLVAFAFILATAFASWVDVTVPSTGLTSGGTFINGGAASDKLGSAVTNLGLFNSDNYNDYVVATATGKAYVILGKSSARTAAIDLNTATVTDVLTITSGYTLTPVVASAGRFFSTSRDALIMSFPGYPNTGGTQATGIVYVIMPRDTAFDFSGGFTSGSSAGVKLTRVSAAAANDKFGSAVACAGEQTTDTLDDIIISDSAASKVYLVPGFSTVPADIDVSSGAPYISITGPSTSFGTSLAGNFDFNGDGKDDFIIGSPVDLKAYVINNQGTTFATLTTAADTTKITVLTGPAGSGFGTTVAHAGDVNDDSVDDVIVGAPLYTPSTLTNAGRAYVAYGSDMNTGATVGTKVADITADSITPSATPKGFIITGGIQASNLGLDADGVGDINGDGIDDLIVSAPYASGSRGGTAGKVHVVFGRTSANSIDLAATSGTSQFTSSVGITITGITSSEFGAAVSRTGDVNGDGYPDFIVGAPNSDYIGSSAARASAGIVYQFNGQKIITGTTGSGFRLEASLLAIVSFFAALMF